MANTKGDRDAHHEMITHEQSVSPDSAFHASDPSTASFTSSEERRPRSKKRKSRSPIQSTARPRSKRLRIAYSDRYRKLFHELVDGLAEVGPSIPLVNSGSTHLGIVAWSSQERQSLLNSIDKYGRHNLSLSTRTLGTKTQVEVCNFVRLLDEAKAKQHIHGLGRALLDASTIPAALEISDECNAALEVAADALTMLQGKEDERVERKRYGDKWLLTCKIAKKVDSCLSQGPDGEAQVTETIPSAVVLNLSAFLRLSSRLFMNSADQEGNWRSLVESRDRPSIFFSAFSDLSNLLLTVTKRLVQSTLYFAMSRIRAMDASTYKASRAVTSQDVRAALEVLSMKATAHDYWVYVARRCRLDIVDRRGRLRKRKVLGRRMDYDEVEAILSQGRDVKGRYASSQSRVGSRAISHTTDSSSRSGFSQEDSEPGSMSDDELPSSPALSDTRLTCESSDSIRAQNRFDHDQLAYISALDDRNSLKEEERLWALLDKAPPKVIDINSRKIPKNPGPERKGLEELGNWRHDVEHIAEWEACGVHVREEEFARNRATWRKRRRAKAKWEDFVSVNDSEDGYTTDNNEDTETSIGIGSTILRGEAHDEDSLPENAIPSTDSDSDNESNQATSGRQEESYDEVSKSAPFPFRDSDEIMGAD